MKKSILILCLLFVFSGCSLFKKKDLPPPEPTRVVIDFEASGDVNPSVTGRASTILVRIYQLKSHKAFEKAEFMELYEKDAKTLGGDLVDQQEIFLKPFETRTIHFKTPDEVESIGILAAFRDYNNDTCKVTAGVRKNRTTVFHVSLKSSYLQLK